MTITVDRDRLVETMRTQAEFGGTGGGGLYRLALTPENVAVRDWLVEEMEDAGLAVRVDEIGNIFGRREGTGPDAPPVLVGSHLDSQPYGGIFDGALGVVAGLEFVRALNDDGLETTHPVEVVSWTNEEGSRFKPGLQGSGVWAGELDLDEEYAREDPEGVTLREALEEAGYLGSTPAEPHEAYEAYLELHIEQGPYLEQNGLDVGVVTGITEIHWGEAVFRGQTNHAGTTPMHLRCDALVAAADTITNIRRMAPALGERTVGTVGELSLEPDQVNIIPGQVAITWDIRDPSTAVIDEAVDRLEQETRMVAEREDVDCEVHEIMRSPGVEFPERCVTAVETAVRELGYEGTRLPSGAGHDATYAARVCDAGMVFAVSERGVSHAEDEYTTWEDCEKAANTLATAALTLANPE